MSWMPMLYKTYQNVMSGDTENLMPPLYPIAHTTQNAEVEVSLDVFGNWIGSAVVEENSKTLIPCTESSASRTSHATPHPLCDKLQYVAGDYTAFGGTKGEQSHIDYMNALKAWCNSAYGGEKVQAIYTYLQKNCLIRDLVNAGTLVCGEDEKLLLKWTGDKAETPKIFKKIVGIQSDAFVRFRVSGGTSNETAVWQDKQLQEDFIRYYASTQNEKALCYVTGEMTACTDNHPSKIRNTGDKAKLISSTDTCGFKFKGRFTNAQQAVSVGYEVSQKAHNALKWLVEKQGKRFGGKVFLLWGTHNEKTPDPTADGFDFYEDAAVPINTDESIARRFNLAAAGYKAELSAHTEL
ncbi:MAG: type I-C CRISPR-associated protein Cas8c/Csd1, partial [Oscillospiraceae bacterium]